MNPNPNPNTNQSYGNPLAGDDWNKIAPFVLGGGLFAGLLGVMGAYMTGMFKDKKTMTKFEKTAVEFIATLCEKIEELQAENEKLRKESADSVPRKALEEALQKSGELAKRVAKLEAEAQPSVRRATRHAKPTNL